MESGNTAPVPTPAQSSPNDKSPSNTTAGGSTISDARRTGSETGREDSKHVSQAYGRGGGRGGHGKKRDMGRNEWSKNKGDKRKRQEDARAAKRQKVEPQNVDEKEDGSTNAVTQSSKSSRPELPIYATRFDEETLKNEERRPKRKVAVMIGYSGTGYKGMQLAHDQKTIEGDLFKAFVTAGAISKANADDPKKSSFVRCARTDKGVHAAGNIISLKLIIEEPDILEKINDALPDQIRIWGWERTNNSFSAYQLCDSRIYEYLIPTHAFLPPHPSSYLGRKCREWAEKKGDVENWCKRQEEVEGFWEKVDDEQIKPVLEEYDESIRPILEKAVWLRAEEEAGRQGDEDSKPVQKHRPNPTEPTAVDTPAYAGSNTDNTAITTAEAESSSRAEEKGVDVGIDEVVNEDDDEDGDLERETPTDPNGEQQPPRRRFTREERIARHKLINDATKRLRSAYVAAKRAYRLSDARLTRISDVLRLYVGTRNYHNYTIQKPFTDPSAKRVIKSFVANPQRIMIDGSEWISLKVHGQSFMMHQIRKMVGMMALVVRCGCDPESRIKESYGPENMSIPKAPSLGLLLERPVFDSYNKRAKTDLSREAIDFDKHRERMDAFKQKWIYERMYHDEERDNVFGNFFNHLDNFPSETFLFVTSGGLEATRTADPEATAGGGEKAKKGLAGGRAGGRVREVDDSDDEEEVTTRDNHGDEG